MPHTDSGLPFSGGVIPLTRHTSKLAAEAAEPKALPQMVRYISALCDAPNGLTDWEAAELLGILHTSVCARRDPLRRAGLIFCNGTRPGPDGSANAIWRWRNR